MRRWVKVLIAAEALAILLVGGLFAWEAARPASVPTARVDNLHIVADDPPPVAEPTAKPTPEPTPEPTPAPPITLAFCGDILLDSGVKRKIYDGGFENVLTAAARVPFQSADVAFVDLELPFSDRGAPVPDKEFNFRGDPGHLDLLTEMGVNIVTLANNHTLDYGRDAFIDTLERLTARNIAYAGAGRDKADASAWRTFDVNGKTIACLAASRVIPAMDWYATSGGPGVFATYDPKELYLQIEAAKAAADYVVVFAHWGIERNDTPENYQKEMARGYIDHGADIVVACHPHVLQGFEYYKGKPIAYSLGNFIFTDARKDTVALTVIIGEDGAPMMRLTPCRITDRQTDVMTSEADLAALKRHLTDISFNIYIDDDWNILPE